MERKPDRSRTLLRRSTDRQELSLSQQLDWAARKAADMGVKFNSSEADLAHMQGHSLSVHNDLYVDDAVTGSDLNRPGLTAFREDAIRDPRTSHVFIYLPDRFARPEEPLDAMRMEVELLKAGLTVVFSNRIALPRRRGMNYFAENIQLLYQYTEAGEYLNLLAQRVIAGHVRIARDGYWAGGRAPYGHCRVLVDSRGQVLQELPDGMKVRQEGCRVKIRPKDPAKIRTWILILEWYYNESLGAAKIARRLNDMGIPSPDAGRTRTDRGIKHRVSGRWSPRTVLTLIRNRAIIGINTYGTQSEGKHRRLGADGSARLLESTDTGKSDKVKVIQNPAAVVISTPTGFGPSADVDLFEACQRQLEERGKCQRGISRRTDPARYPMAMRLWDMTDGCGHPLYAKTSGKRTLYVCGRYMKTAGSECAHNYVDGEAVLAFVVAFIKQQAERHGGRAALKASLERIAAGSASARSGADRRQAAELALREAGRVLADAEAEERLIRRNLARAKDEQESEIIREELVTQRDHVGRARRAVEQCRSALEARTAGTGDVTAQIEAALSLYDELEAILIAPDARAALAPLFQKINLRLWLNFGSGKKGNRDVRLLKGGILTTGDAKTPVQPYGSDGDGRSAGRGDPGRTPVAAGVNETPSVELFSRSEGVSFTMVNRGDKI